MSEEYDRTSLADRTEAVLDELREPPVEQRHALLATLLEPVAAALRRDTDATWATRDSDWPEFTTLGVPICPGCGVAMDHEDSWGSSGRCHGVGFWCTCGRCVVVSQERATP